MSYRQDCIKSEWLKLIIYTFMFCSAYEKKIMTGLFLLECWFVPVQIKWISSKHCFINKLFYIIYSTSTCSLHFYNCIIKTLKVLYIKIFHFNSKLSLKFDLTDLKHKDGCGFFIILYWTVFYTILSFYVIFC